MFLSETYSIFDCLFLDYAVTGKKNSNWTNYDNNITVTVSENYTTLTAGVDNNQNRYIVPLADTPVEPFVVEFKKYNAVADGVYLIIGSRVINLYSLWNGHLRDANHIKFTVDNGEIICEHDGTIESSVTTYTSLTAGVQYRFNNLASGSLQYTDFKIYPI